MKILITDHHCASQRGDAAIVEGMLASLKKRFPDASFHLLTDFPRAARLFHGLAVDPQLRMSVVPVRKCVGMLYLLVAAAFYRRGIKLPFIHHGRVAPYLEADVVISKGGGMLGDFHGVMGRIWGMYFAKLLGKPVMVYAQSIGPLDRRVNRWLAGWVLNRVDLITVRDQKSREILHDAGVEQPPIHVVADAAFAMPETSSAALQLIEPLEIPKLPDPLNGPRISISVRRWIYLRSEQGMERYLGAVAALVDWLIEKKGAEIIFVSTCTGLDGYHSDDRVVALDVAARVKMCNRRWLRIACAEYTPQQLSRLYGMMDLHVGTRMHSNILAMMAGTPVAAIEYEFKTGELMQRCGLGEYVVGMERVTADKLIDMVDRALRDAPQIKERIREALPELRREADRSAHLLQEMLEAQESAKDYGLAAAH